MEIPLHLKKLAAGFPSPAYDFLDRKIDLNKELIRHPATTFFVRAEGDSMRDAGILLIPLQSNPGPNVRLFSGF